MKKLIIFDLDGTLIDTLEDLKNSVNYALNLRSFPLKSKEDIRKAIGNGVAKLVARSMPDNEDNPEYQDTLADFKKHYSKYSCVYTIPYVGVKEVLINLKSQGYILAVATNKLTDVARPMIDGFYPGLFDFIQGDEPGMDRKPAPMMVESLCQRFNVTKKEAFYIGDTNVDMQTAINSGVDYVLVTYGYRTKEELLLQCKGSPLIDSIDELPNYLKKIESA
jgi:phosphoglycolate phosphatase